MARSFIGAVLTLFFFALMFRVYWVQAVEAEELLVKAKAMWEQSKVLTPSRGVIYDRNGNVLAQDAPSYTVAVNPRLIHEEGVKYDVIDLLAEPLGLDHHEGRRKLGRICSAVRMRMVSCRFSVKSAMKAGKSIMM